MDACSISLFQVAKVKQGCKIHTKGKYFYKIACVCIHTHTCWCSVVEWLLWTNGVLGYAAGGQLAAALGRTSYWGYSSWTIRGLDLYQQHLSVVGLLRTHCIHCELHTQVHNMRNEIYMQSKTDINLTASRNIHMLTYKKRRAPYCYSRS